MNTYKVEIVDIMPLEAGSFIAILCEAERGPCRWSFQGNYKIVAKSGVLQDASRTPYLKEALLLKKQGMESKAEVLCKSATVKSV